MERLNPKAYEGISESANDRATKAYELLEEINIKNYWSDKQFVSYRADNTNYIIDTRKKNLIEDYCILFLKTNEPIILNIDSWDRNILQSYFK